MNEDTNIPHEHPLDDLDSADIDSAMRNAWKKTTGLTITTGLSALVTYVLFTAEVEPDAEKTQLYASLLAIAATLLQASMLVKSIPLRSDYESQDSTVQEP